MKPRPRSVEREVAEFLSRIYQANGYSPVKRIPILGRTGPDIELNETGFVIDVKSRLAVPQSHMLKAGTLGRFGLGASADYIGVRLSELGRESFKGYDIRPSKMVWDWLCHMDEWRSEQLPNGISVIILHKNRTRVANATFVIKTYDWRRVCQTIKTSLSSQLPAITS